MAYNKKAYKYPFKFFYTQTKKKKHKLQILKYNIYYTNIIAMQNTIFIDKVLVESTKKKKFLLTFVIQKLREYKM